ncbi:MAG: tripartite tricarboxylate transporter permease [Salinarimonadaceae bacterium]|nr:MAG: tripartite tricarboxylate transporter permease [Salinarimonadaceae bacterium]
MEFFTVGFPVAFSLENLFYCFFGVFLGTFIGVLPGIGALTAIAMLLPVSFYLDPTTGIILLAGVYYGAEYGGSTAAILLNLPGTPSNAVTALDGYPMTKNGRAGIALLMTSVASFVGGSIGILALTFLTQPIVSLALSFSSAEMFAAMTLGLIAAATIGQGSPIKGVAMVLVGMLLGSIGIDLDTGRPRFTFGMMELFDGVSIAILAMGLFGVSELIASVNSGGSGYRGKITLRSMVPSREDLRRSFFPMLRGAGVGGIFGPMPGTGPSIAAFLSYALEKRISRRPGEFGKGAIEGIAAPESANNSAVQTAFIPTLALGIPGSATMAVILGALMIHGITPGPRFITNHPDMYWGLIVSFWIGNIFLLIINIPLVGLWVKLLHIPYNYLFPAIIALVCVGAYSFNQNPFDVFLLLFFGFVGYGLKLAGFHPAPLLIGYLLGPMVEENLRRALQSTQGDFIALFDRPITAVLLSLSLAMIAWMTWTALRPLMHDLSKRNSPN